MKDYLASLVTEGRLSRNTLRLIICSLRVIFNAAIEDNIVEHNPAARLGRSTKSDRPKFRATPLTGKESRAVFERLSLTLP